jgi:glutamyl-tRNA synthetase
LHVGNARTALFNWLFARKLEGRFILRIDDTDPERSRREFEDAIFGDLRWLGLDWDEGPDVDGRATPYRQSEAGALYREATEELLRQGLAYRCFCSVAELEAERRRQEETGQPPRYSGRCRDLTTESADRLLRAGELSAVRFKMPSGEIVVADLVKGAVRFHGRDLDDFILLRADGSASYHLAVVVDDHRMGITHVIRGEDHLSNAPRHMALATALGYDPPRFAHVPLILGWDGVPLSKRHGTFSVDSLRDPGFLPEAVVNYLGLLGWSPPEGVPEVMTLREMAEHFTLERVSGSPARFDQGRLSWFNRQHFRRYPMERLLAALRSALDRLPTDQDTVRRAIEGLRGDSDSLPALERELVRILTEPDPLALRLTAADRRALEVLHEALESAPVSTSGDARDLLERVTDGAATTKQSLMRAARLALMGSPQGPPVATLLWILGPERARRRLARALAVPVGS